MKKYELAKIDADKYISLLKGNIFNLEQSYQATICDQNIKIDALTQQIE